MRRAGIARNGGFAPPADDDMKKLSFRPYRQADFATCMRIFDGNCPEYLAAWERQEYEHYLTSDPQGYEVCELDGCVLGVFGVSENENGEARLNWILIDAQSHGAGLGRNIMHRALESGAGIAEICNRYFDESEGRPLLR